MSKDFQTHINELRTIEKISTDGYPFDIDNGDVERYINEKLEDLEFLKNMCERLSTEVYELKEEIGQITGNL